MQASTQRNNEESNSIISNTTNRIRFLVDIDKNPEIMQALFSKNRTVEKPGSDPREYQVILNLNDYVNAKEEEMITRKLVDLAASEGHLNLTKNSMPKILYVVPVFNENEDDPVANALKKVNGQNNDTQEDDQKDDESDAASNTTSQNIRPNAVSRNFLCHTLHRYE